MNRSATLLILCLGVAIAIATAIAQRPAGAQAVQDTASALGAETRMAPAAIPASEIAPVADRTRGELRGIVAPLASRQMTAGIDSALTALRQSPGFQNARAATEHLADLSLGQIADLELDWQRYAGRLTTWTSVLDVEAKRLDADLESLVALRDRWQATLDGATREELPPAAVQTAHAVLAEVERTHMTVRSALNQLVAAQSNVAEETEVASEALAQLAGATQRAHRRMLRRDSPPIWRIWATEPTTFRYVSTPAQHMNRIRRYITDNRERGGGQIVLFIAVLAVLTWVRRQSRRMDRDASHHESGPAWGLYALEHPLSGALLLTFIATVLIHPLAPQALRTLGTLIAIVPLLRLLPGVVPPGLRRPSNAFLLLYFLANLVGILAHKPILLRLGFLIIIALAGGGLARFLRPGNPALRAEGRLWQASLVVLRGALVIFAVSLAANLLGFVPLSIWLTYNTLRVMFAGLALLVGAATLDGLIVLGLRTRPAQSLRAIRLNLDAITRRSTGLVHLAAGLIWVATALHRFSVLAPVWNGLLGVMTTPLRIGSVKLALVDILLFLFILWLSVVVSGIVRQLLREDILSRVSLPRGMPDTISQVASYAVLALGFLFAIAAAGLDMSRFAILAGAFGVGIGFGLQTIVNNFISGLILLFERPIQAGDTIELDNLIGNVRAIGIRASRVRTFDGADVIVPNADLISGRVVNWTLSDKLRRIELKVGVAYGTDPTRVKDLLSKVAAGHRDVLAAPPPVALFKGFGDSSLDFVLRFWTADFENWLIIGSDVATAVHDALSAAGIQIPFPQRDLHLRTVAPEAREALGPTRAVQQEK